jgi:hypothetical protein
MLMLGTVKLKNIWFEILLSIFIYKQEKVIILMNLYNLKDKLSPCIVYQVLAFDI